MVFPLYDENPFVKPNPPFATWSLIAINVVVFLAMLGASESDRAIWIFAYGVTPAALTATTLGHGVGEADLTLLTGMFMHGGWGHLLGNTIYLWVFGDDIEEAFGWARFVAFYLLAGVASSLFFVALNHDSGVPLIGASGAISGILAGYLLLRPCARVSVFVLPVVLRLRAYWVIGGWVLLQFFLAAKKPDAEVAYLAHIGGLGAGVVLFFLLRPAGVKLFECTDPSEAVGPALPRIRSGLSVPGVAPQHKR